MKIQFKGLFLTALFFCSVETLMAQKTSDAKFIFKTWLFLEHNNVTSRYATQFPVKDSVLFNLSLRLVNIKFDTLKTRGFSKDYIFLSVDLTGRKDSTIKYQKTPLIQYVDIPVDNCEGYVLCINKAKGTSYRLKGFSGNDFLGLFHETQAKYLQDINKRLSIKQFLKNYFVDELDFECLYAGLISGENDLNKFPCLKNCSNISVTVH